MVERESAKNKSERVSGTTYSSNSHQLLDEIRYTRYSGVFLQVELGSFKAEIEMKFVSILVGDFISVAAADNILH